MHQTYTSKVTKACLRLVKSQNKFIVSHLVINVANIYEYLVFKVQMRAYSIPLLLSTLCATVILNTTAASYISPLAISYIWALTCIWIFLDGIILAKDLKASENKVQDLQAQLHLKNIDTNLIIKTIDENHKLLKENQSMKVLLKRKTKLTRFSKYN